MTSRLTIAERNHHQGISRWIDERKPYKNHPNVRIKLSDTMYWPTPCQDIERYVRSCHAYQQLERTPEYGKMEFHSGLVLKTISF